ncbi:MAG: hypothetical protein AB8B94_10465 [Hyphomicrobiales bacterium]
MVVTLIVATAYSQQAKADYATAENALKSCGLSPAPTGRIASIDHLGLVQLEDGRKMRLSGVWLMFAQKNTALSSFRGRTVTPYPAAQKADHTGSIAAHFMLSPSQSQRSSEEPWLQAEILSMGTAFLYIYPDRTSCADELREFENKAITSSKGFWSQVLRQDIFGAPAEQSIALIVGEADNLEIESAEGRYGIISGRVLSTGKSGRWRYLNFGDNFSRDFTVRVTARVEKRLIEQGLTIKRLEDKRIEVRGVIQSNGGPMIDVFDAAQIVIME